ncbi:hypothetical protein [Kribbella sp. NPDC000426]|uniref:hypothetical protein n=1 Tax=Kribbella sp. NPDC000426 TaxID=3154255 RepID=UPI0033276E81
MIAADQLAECIRHGRGWKVTYSGESVVVGHLVGMLHVAVLLANPLREIPSIELAGGVNALGMSSRRHTQSAQVVLDHEAVGSYRRKLDELRAEAGRLDALGDQGRAAAVQPEIDWLLRELATASGLSGRVRNFTDNPERARVAVGKAVRRAISRVELIAPAIGTHLRESVHTGLHCVYQPA